MKVLLKSTTKVKEDAWYKIVEFKPSDAELLLIKTRAVEKLRLCGGSNYAIGVYLDSRYGKRIDWNFISQSESETKYKDEQIYYYIEAPSVAFADVGFAKENLNEYLLYLKESVSKREYIIEGEKSGDFKKAILDLRLDDFYPNKNGDKEETPTNDTYLTDEQLEEISKEELVELLIKDADMFEELKRKLRERDVNQSNVKRVKINDTKETKNKQAKVSLYIVVARDWRDFFQSEPQILVITGNKEVAHKAKSDYDKKKRIEEYGSEKESLREAKREKARKEKNLDYESEEDDMDQFSFVVEKLVEPELAKVGADVMVVLYRFGGEYIYNTYGVYFDSNLRGPNFKAIEEEIFALEAAVTTSEDEDGMNSTKETKENKKSYKEMKKEFQDNDGHIARIYATVV